MGDSKARIAVLTSVHKPSNARIFHKQCQTLATAGYDVTLIAPADFGERTREGVRILGVPAPHSRWERPLVWMRLLRWIARLEPDLVHFHDPELLVIVPFLRLAVGRQVRIVYDVHEYFVDSIAHKVWIPGWLRPTTAALAAGAERVLGRHVDGLVFVVEQQADLYAGWNAERAVVHNYPAVSAFAGAEPIPGFPEDRFRLIYLGSLYARRGIMTMVKALAEIVPQAPETLLILGGAFESEVFRRHVDGLIARKGLEAHVDYVGWVDHSEVKNYLASADVAWLPGLRVKQYRRQAVSTKQLECMLMGLPIVSSDHPHRRAFLEEADSGLSVTPDDPTAHAEAVLWLYRHPEERRRMGERARQTVLKRYTWEREAEQLLALYDRLLNREVT